MDRIEANYQRWLSSPAVKEETKETLRAMSQKEKEDAFFKDIEFGTGGMRGVLGPGTNRMNEFTVRRAAVAFGRFLLEKFPDAKNRGVALSHDNRHHSRDFVLQSASLLNEMGIKCYIFDSLRPTPELSFAIRYTHAVGGVMVTASHNPKQYNGYKVYDETGFQLVPSKIARYLEIIAEYPDELSVEVPTAPEKGETITFDKKIDDDYVALVEGCQIHPELPKEGFKIVYTPQHGASYENAVRVFTECGYEFFPVKEQCVHDPDFGATKSPNPENPEAYEGAIALAKKISADLVVTTDPDGDRCGLAYRGKDGDYHLLTGNQSGALLIDYVLGQRKALGKLSSNGVLYDTIVTSSLGVKIAQSYGVSSERFLTGFKYIGDRIGYYEALGHGPHFEFGYEESYGCLIQPFVRDKDGIQAILLYSEMALFYHLKGMDLGEAFEALQRKYGFHDATSVSHAFPGPEGAKEMAALMDRLRKNPLKELAGSKAIRIEDYLLGVIREEGKPERASALPKENVIKIVFADTSWLAVRPSGTEPKIKFYVEAVAKEEKDLPAKKKAMYDGLFAELGLQ